MYTYANPSSKLSTVKVGSAMVQTITGDTTGNITQDPLAPVGQVKYFYDNRNLAPYGRLVKTQGPGAQFSYLTNHLGQRIRKTGTSYTPSGGSAITPAAYIGSTDTVFHYDLQGHLIAEQDAATKQVKREYIWLGDTPVAVIAGATPTAQISASNAATVYYIHTDHLDTPRLVTDTAGNKRWSWSIVTTEPFGASPADEAPQTQATAQQFTLNLRFPGQYLDKETGTFYNYHRTYNPATGRYLQSDPIGLNGGINTYAYVEGNPLSYVDPTGEIAFIPIVIGIGVGYAFDYLLEQYKKEHCTCKDTPAGAAGNAAAGGAIGGAGRFASKPRGGIAGGGRSGTGTSSFSQMNHAAARSGWYSIATRNGITKVLRKVPYAGSALAAYEVYDAFSCD